MRKLSLTSLSFASATFTWPCASATLRSRSGSVIGHWSPPLPWATPGLGQRGSQGSKCALTCPRRDIVLSLLGPQLAALETAMTIVATARAKVPIATQLCSKRRVQPRLGAPEGRYQNREPPYPQLCAAPAGRFGGRLARRLRGCLERRRAAAALSRRRRLGSRAECPSGRQRYDSPVQLRERQYLLR